MPLSIGMGMNIGGGICCGVDMEIKMLGNGSRQSRSPHVEFDLGSSLFCQHQITCMDDSGAGILRGPISSSIKLSIV